MKKIFPQIKLFTLGMLSAAMIFCCVACSDDSEKKYSIEEIKEQYSLDELYDEDEIFEYIEGYYTNQELVKVLWDDYYELCYSMGISNPYIVLQELESEKAYDLMQSYNDSIKEIEEYLGYSCRSCFYTPYFIDTKTQIIHSSDSDCYNKIPIENREMFASILDDGNISLTIEHNEKLHNLTVCECAIEDNDE